MPTSGLVFYAPLLNASAPSAETGQALTYTNTFTEETLNNVPSLYTSGSRLIKTADVTGLPIGNTPWTMSIWMNGKGLGGGNTFNYVMSMGKAQQGSYMLLGTRGTTQFQYGPAWADHLFNGFSEGTWYNLTESYDGTTLYFYLNGVLLGSGAYSASITYDASYAVTICGLTINSEYFEGNVAGARIYNRCLTANEIALLATEYKPKFSPVFNSQSIAFSYETGAATKQLSFDAKGQSYSFSITSGALPSSVRFNSSGSFSYDGSEIVQDEDFALGMQMTGERLMTTSANVTLKMSVVNSIPTDYYFYMPMTNASTYDSSEAGVSPNVYGNVEFTQKDGISCATLTGDISTDYITITNDVGAWPDNLNSGGDPIAFSFWLKINNYEVDKGRPILSMGRHVIGAMVGIMLINESVYKGFYLEYDSGNTGGNVISGAYNNSAISDGNWHHVYMDAYNLNNYGTSDIYVDGVFAYRGRVNFAKNTSTNYVPRLNGATFVTKWDKPIDGYISAFRIYNRILAQAEITALANEFTPST